MIVVIMAGHIQWCPMMHVILRRRHQEMEDARCRPGSIVVVVVIRRSEKIRSISMGVGSLLCLLWWSSMDITITSLGPHTVVVVVVVLLGEEKLDHTLDQGQVTVTTQPMQW